MNIIFKNIRDLLEHNPLTQPEFNTLHHKALLNKGEHSFVLIKNILLSDNDLATGDSWPLWNPKSFFYDIRSPAKK